MSAPELKPYHVKIVTPGDTHYAHLQSECAEDAAIFAIATSPLDLHMLPDMDNSIVLISVSETDPLLRKNLKNVSLPRDLNAIIGKAIDMRKEMRPFQMVEVTTTRPRITWARNFEEAKSVFEGLIRLHPELKQQKESVIGTVSGDRQIMTKENR